MSGTLIASDGRSASATTAPSTITDPAMPISTPGNTIPLRPSAAPTAITAGNVSGRSHSARPPSCEAQRPTATIASAWSRPVNGCSNPSVKLICEWSPTCASATVLKLAIATAASESSLNERRMVFLMAERRMGERRSKYAVGIFTPTAGALSIHVDEHRAGFDCRRIGLHRNHAGRRHDLTGFDVELTVVEVAFDHVAVDEAFRQGARAMGAGIIGD